MFTLPAGLTVIVRSQALKPDFPIVIVCSPMLKRNVDGVLPTNLPSTVMSAPSGVDLIMIVEGSAADGGVTASGEGSVVATFGANFAGSSGASPL
ncbi:MAG: hypothetical protein AABO41_22770 [Acidobacteriota bacterium]